MKLLPFAAAAAFAVGTFAAEAQAEDKAASQPIVVAEVPSVPAAAIYLAVEKGYFKDAGLQVDLQNIESSSTAMALLASNRVQAVGGGVAPNYWNALASGLPVILALERASSPLYHDVLIRKDLVGKIKTPADLKGRPVAEVSPGSSALYEVGQVLASAGLTLKDIDVKYIPFTQMGTALANGAVDAAFEVPPFGAIVAARGEGVKWIDPENYIKVLPTTFVGYFANTDWIKDNPDAAKKFFAAIVRGSRDFCQAYHHGPNRAEVVDVMFKYKVGTDRDQLDKMDWQARSPNGRFNIPSVLDLQDWFFKEGIIKQKFPAERLIDSQYADYAEKTLPPFEVTNKADQLKGCR
ncbi:MAG TPA: ABC transporter substrate-binding protein [Stellaceae bacterium]|jgi:NitT/TauT family transport system substrate-binding protein|nr:ABC transporter substrate-binding protein [Stellaceae bacterium]